MAEHVLTGFGFGPIQAGLFVKEAYQSGDFTRIVVAEIDQKLVDAVRANNGSYYVNVAGKNRIEAIKIDNIEIYNPQVERDKKLLLEALSSSTEIVTSLPAVTFYDAGQPSVASLITQALTTSRSRSTIIYTAENNNHAAEILEKTVRAKNPDIDPAKVQFLNTVIGKMSGIVTDPREITELKLKTITPAIGRSFLVEEFNRILVTRSRPAGFQPGIRVFIQKDDLLPFEEAKLYGHNAIHALLAYLAAMKGYHKMTELAHDPAIMAIGRKAFLDESGAALIKKYARLGDELFTPTGYRLYADDLLERMTNPYLSDTIERAGRDPLRKLGYHDRLCGTMALALEQGVEPVNLALGAMAGIVVLLQQANTGQVKFEGDFPEWRRLTAEDIEKILYRIWANNYGEWHSQIIECIQAAKKILISLLEN